MNSREDGDEGFVMVHQRDLDTALTLIGERRLELRDAAVFLALINYINWRNGRSHVTAKHIAKRLNIKLPVAVSALSRLKKEMLVSRVIDRHSGEHYYLVNPYLASVGGPQRRGHLWQQFQESLE